MGNKNELLQKIDEGYSKFSKGQKKLADFIKEDYDKVLEGNLIALEIGFSKIMEKCTRFRAWIEKLIELCKEP